jgi:hypothetical protein
MITGRAARARMRADKAIQLLTFHRAEAGLGLQSAFTGIVRADRRSLFLVDRSRRPDLRFPAAFPARETARKAPAIGVFGPHALSPPGLVANCKPVKLRIPVQHALRGGVLY